MRIAVISDVHDNLGTLQALLSDIETRDVDITVNLGDALSGPLFPSECANLFLHIGLPTIRGNHERQLLSLQPEEMGSSPIHA